MKVVDGGIIIMYLMTQNMLVHACDVVKTEDAVMELVMTEVVMTKLEVENNVQLEFALLAGDH